MVQFSARLLVLTVGLFSRLMTADAPPIFHQIGSGFVRVVTLPTGGALKSPTGAAVLLPDGHIVVADRGGHQIRILRPTGDTVLIVGSGKPGFQDGALLDASFNEPTALAIDIASGAVYVSDRGNHSIRRVTLGGVVSTIAGTGHPADRDGLATEAEFKRPSGLAIDVAGNLYVADTGNHKVRKIAATGMVTTFAGAGRPGYADARATEALFAEPEGVAVATDGTVYVSDTGNHVIRRVMGGVVSTFAGAARPGNVNGGALTAEFKFPAGLALTAAGDLFVADRGNHQIRRVAVGDSVVMTVAGNGAPGFADGEAVAAQLHEPEGITSAGALFVADTRNSAIRIIYPGVQLTSVTPNTGDPSGGTVVRISGSGFVPGTTSAMFGSAAATSISFVSGTEVAATTPAGTGTVDVQVTTPGGTAALPKGYRYGVPFVALSIEPASVTLEVDEMQSFTARALRGDGVTVDVTSSATWTTSDSSVVEIDQRGSARAVAEGAATVTAQFNGLSATANVSVETTPTNFPPDPVTTATPTDPSIVTDIGASVKFLYEGPNPVQTGVISGAIQQHRVSVIRGRVLTPGGAPLSGVRVTVQDREEYGETLSRADGWYDLAVNGGGPVTIRYEKTGVIPSQRTATPRWNDFDVLADVVMTAYDSAVTRVDLAGVNVPVTARANTASDQDGVRRATLVVSPGTSASMVLPNGTRTGLPAVSLRATEFTVGPNGPKAMPAGLPTSSAYTYCVELSADEAVAAGADSVEFSQPLYFYVENFIGMPVGEIVPAGYFDRRRNVWVASDNGVVIQIISSTDVAAIDADGDGLADSDAALAARGFTTAERQLLARTYAAGTELWRAPVRHFSPYDFNYPSEPPPASDPIEAFGETRPDDTCTLPGSVIECENQTLRESIPLAGTAFELTYSSARVPGRRSGREVEVRLTGAQVHPELRRLDVRAEVAGRQITASYPAAPNLRFTYQWDGKDAYGRTVYGTHIATVTVTHVYNGNYERVAPAEGTFGTYGIGEPLILSRTELQQSTTLTVPLINIDDRGKNLGGWSLGIHHSYDAAGSQTSFGDGSTRTSGQAKGTIRTIVGFPFRRSTSPAGCADGPAANGVARISYPRALAGTADGSVYFADTCQTLRLLNAAGQVSTVIPVGAPVSGGNPSGVTDDLAVGPNGSVYLLQSERHRILRRDSSGALSVFAGAGTAGFSGDGGPATAAQFNLYFGSRMALGPDGSLYIADSNNFRIRRVSTDGRVTTIAGTGSNSGEAADGALASESVVNVHTAMRAGIAGEVYFLEGSRIRMITAEGRIETFANLPPLLVSTAGRSGMAISPGGEIYLSTMMPGGNPHRFSITRFSKTGESELIADGTGGDFRFGLSDIYFAGEGGPATAAGYGEPQNIALGADGSMLVADTISSRIRRIALESGLRRSNGVYVPSADGSLLHQFDTEGRHLRTIDTLTRVALYEFTYDPQKRIETLRDADGRTTSFAYDGDQVTVTSPTGDITTLTLDGNRYLSSVTSKLGTYRVTHDGQGLLQRFENPRQHASTFTWEPNGRLRRDSDAAGGYTEVSRVADGPDGWTITTTTAEERTKTYEREAGLTEDTRRVTAANGLTTVMTRAATSAMTTSSPTGVSSTSAFLPDLIFGMTAPLLQSGTVRMPSGLTKQVAQSRTLGQFADGDALFVNALTDTIRVNGRPWTAAWTFSDRKFRLVSPAGRVAEQLLDSAGRVIEARAPGVLPVSYTYDSLGRPKTVTQGTRSASFVWNDGDELTSLTDPLRRTVTFEYDSASRVKRQTLPGDRAVQYQYDANGNIVSLTPPVRPAHQFGFNSIDLTTSYQPPALAGVSDETSYRYNHDRDLTELTRAADETTKLTYDGSGRLATVGSSTRTVTVGYDPAGRLASLSGDTGPSVTYTWDGNLPVQVTWSGDVTGNVSWGYDTDFRPAEETVNGAPIAMTYDADSLLRSAGALDIQRDPVSGRATGTTLGGITDSYIHDEYGALKSYSASYNGTEIFKQSFTRDALDRIVTEIGTLYGVTSTRVFTYDGAGRLETVTRDGVLGATYGYDANGNRLSKVTPSTTFAGTYDVHDRLSSYGDTSYTYTAAGDLLTKTVPAGTTSYSYDSFGNLRTVNLPEGQKIEYIIDGQNRRVGKKVNGVLVRRWLYADQLRIVAELDGSGKVISRFVYGTRSHAPDYMIRDNVTYRIISDHLGSPRLVINTATGNAAQMIGYDEFGNVLADTAPGLQPFYFAGGLYDSDTGLVRFGARDYDPQMGRWISKDSSLFRGGTNLYGYAYGDPVNYIDLDGQVPVPLVTGGIGALVGGLTSIGMQLWNNSGDGLGAAFRCIDWGDVAIAAGTGFLAGAAAPFTATTWLGAIGTSALANEVQYVATETSNGRTPEVTGALWSIGTGAVAGGVGGKFTPVSAGYNANSVITSPHQREIFKALNDTATNEGQVAGENILRNALGNVAAGAPAPGAGSGGDCGCR